MRNLFETRKEHKTLKLAKKLQEEADKEWESEIKRRKEQELNDEAIAKELQAQLEQENGTSSSPSITASINATSKHSSPPPLPAKPTAYNSASTIHSSGTPLSGLSNSPQSDTFPKLPPRTADYMPAKPSQSTYKPGLQFTISSPAPQPSTVFSTNTPKLPTRKTHDSEPAYPKDTIQSINNKPINYSATSNTFNNSQKQGTISSHASESLPSASMQSSNNTATRMEMPTPVVVTPISHYGSDTTSYTHAIVANPAAATTATYSSSSLPNMNNNEMMASPPPFVSQRSDPIILPLAQSMATSQPVIPIVPHNSQFNNPNNSSYSMYSIENNPYVQQPSRQPTIYPSFQPPIHNNVSAASLLVNSNDSLHNSQAQQNHHHPYPQQYNCTATNQEIQQQSNSYSSINPQPLTSASNTIKKQNEYTPIYKKHSQKPLFSSSTISLKPDEGSVYNEPDDEDEPKQRTGVKNRPPTPVESATIETNVHISEDEDSCSEVDYSDMIYKKGSTGSLMESKKDNGWKMTKKTEPTAISSQQQPHQQQQKDIEEYNSSGDDEDDEAWQDDAIDPFADNVDIDTTAGSGAAEATTATDVPASPFKRSKVTTLSPTLEIIDPTMPRDEENTKRVSILFNDTKEDGKKNETTIVNSDGPRQYAEKESKDIEEGPFTTPAMTPAHASRNHSHSITASMFSSPIAATMQTRAVTSDRLGYPKREYSSPAAVPTQTPPIISAYQQQQQHYPVSRPAHPSRMNTSPADYTGRVYPQNQLKAGALAQDSTTPAETEHQFRPGVVPATDFGYLKEGETMNKSLPTLPNATATEDRHITVASINPGQRVWIRIQPTDTGKALAERIQIVASYRTRRVTKITSKSGRDIPLTNKPLFDDWNELLTFTDGETWKVEWVPIENPYVDIFTEGKEFMKQLKATLKSGSSSSS